MKLSSNFLSFFLIILLFSIIGCLKNISDNNISDDTRKPIIQFTYVPSYGSFEHLQGQVKNVNPVNYKVAAYIFVSGWWTKPYFSSPLTTINSDGSWECDITTGGMDQNATEIAAFLVPNGYNPPIMDGKQTLPKELYEKSVSHKEVEREARYRIVEFSGYKWKVKATETMAGPGPNFFSENEQDIWVDEKGQLHMKISYRDGKWYCTEVINDTSLGYGKYIFQLSTRVDKIDKNAVLGLFTWDDTAPEHHYREIDIEFTKWEKTVNENAQYVVQPWDTTGNMIRFNIDLTSDYSTHVFIWQADSIVIQSFHGHFDSPPNGESLINAWIYKGDYIPTPGMENVRINLWLSNGNPPSDGKEVEVVIKYFKFLP